MITGLCNPFGKGDGDNGVFGKLVEVVNEVAEVKKNALGKTSRNKAWNAQNGGLPSLAEMTEKNSIFK